MIYLVLEEKLHCEMLTEINPARLSARALMHKHLQTPAEGKMMGVKELFNFMEKGTRRRAG